MTFSDLKPAENNFGFNIEVLEKCFAEKLKKPFSTKTMFKILSGAKGFGKTYLICLLALFFVCNFEDFNAQLAKYTFVSAKANYDWMMYRVMHDLQQYGVNLKTWSGKGKVTGSIKIKSNQNEYRWIFGNGRVIEVIGFDNTSSWEGIPAPTGEWGMFAIDEVIPIDQPIEDEEGYLYQLMNILVQIVRGQNLATSTEAFPELEANGWQLYKQHLVIFGFNNHDTSHPIYQVFANTIAPLTDDIKKELEDNAVSFREDPDFFNVGAVLIRGTTEINAKNLNIKLKEFGEGIKERFPEIYDTLFLGAERQLSIDRYSYRKDLISHAKFFDPKEFYWKKPGRFWFDEIRIGSDYADGGDMGDDAVTVLFGYEFDKEGYVEGVYVAEELSISTKKYKNMTEKVRDIADHLNIWANKYQLTKNQTFLKDKMKFRIGHDSRTIKDFLAEILSNEYQFNGQMLRENFSCFKATGGSRSWSIDSRHYTWKRLLAEGKLYFSKNLKVTKNINGVEVEIKKHGYLFDELFNCLNHPKENKRDERPKKNKLDAINAGEHSLSYFRFALFKN